MNLFTRLGHKLTSARTLVLFQRLVGRSPEVRQATLAEEALTRGSEGFVAEIASILVSRFEVGSVGALRAPGFRPGGRRPLRLSHAEPPAFYPLQQLSYFNTELVYHF